MPYDNAFYLGNTNNPYHALVRAKSNTIQSIQINEQTRVIAGTAFYDCINLTDVRMSDGVIFIGSLAFYGCKALLNISIPNSIDAIGDGAFAFCTSLTEFAFPSNDSASDVQAPMISLGTGLFRECSNLATVSLGNRIIRIPVSMFDGCGLLEITIPDGVVEIGSSAFNGCSNMQKIEIPDTVSSIGAHAFDCCKKLKTISIPDKVKRIEEYTFYQCGELSIIEFGSGISEIGRYAFYGCGMECIEIPNQVTEIDNCAFASSDLEEVILGKNVGRISPAVFEDCFWLKRIAILGSIQYIGIDAFADCKRLTDVFWCGDAVLWRDIWSGNDYFTSATWNGHSLAEATCTTPKTCTYCGETIGEPLGHNWLDATCIIPRTCSLCGLTEGGSSWS